jgi:hypothetical protein
MMRRLPVNSCISPIFTGMKFVLSIAGLLLPDATAHAQCREIGVQWNDTIAVSRSTPTFQVVGNLMLRRGAPMHDASFQAVNELRADDVRYVPWFPYPKLAVAGLKPPSIPLNMISYHCYAHANEEQPFEDYDYAVFDSSRAR